MAVVVREVPLLTLKILVIDVFDVPCGQNCVVGCSLASISEVQGVKTSSLVEINVYDLLLDEFKLEQGDSVISNRFEAGLVGVLQVHTNHNSRQESRSWVDFFEIEALCDFWEDLAPAGFFAFEPLHEVVWLAVALDTNVVYGVVHDVGPALVKLVGESCTHRSKALLVHSDE